MRAKQDLRISVLFVISIFAISIFFSMAYPSIPASNASSPPINNTIFPFYNLGLQSMFNTLLKPAPCGSGLTALSEAPSVPYNWWTDDNAKALGALSYTYPNFASQDSELLSFVQHNTVGGYLTNHCVQITPSIVNSSLTNMTVRNNLYIIQGNPTLGLSNPSQLFRIYDNENPQIALAYIESQVASVNNISLALDTGIAQVVIDGGFDANGAVQSPWTGTGGVNSTYYRSPPHTLILDSSQFESQIFQANAQQGTSLAKNMTWWVTSGSGANEQYDAIVNYTDGTSSTFLETALPSTNPGTFNEGIILGSQLTAGKTVKGVEFSTSGQNGTDVMIDDVSFYYQLFTPQFHLYQVGQNMEMSESETFQSVNITMSYTLVPNLPYINVTTTLTNNGVTSVVNPSILNAFDGLDSISSGYSSLYFPGFGWERANQTNNALTGTYLPSGWNQNWFAIGIRGIPDWIGNDGIFVILNQQNMPGGTASIKLNQIFNTEFQNSTFTSPGDYLHWLQMSFNDPGSVAPGQSISYNLKYIFVTDYDWTNMPIYSNFLNGNNIKNWNNTNISNNYYYGEVANDLALYAKATGAQSSPAYPTALQVWNYYYRMIREENNGTYTASLARFINASDTLYEMTGNSTYLAAITYGANLLETMQQETSQQSASQNFYFHYDPSIVTLNGQTTFGAIFNSSARMEIGKVYSGQTVSLNFFLSPVIANSIELGGTVQTVFYMNANTHGVQAMYNTSISYITSSQSSLGLTGSSTQVINLPSGKGHPAFSPFESDISLSNYMIPAGSTIVIHLMVSVPTGDTVYVLIDSTNGPSSITLPFLQNALWEGAFTILPPKETAAIAAPQQQPYALDLTAIGGKALYTAYEATGNATCLNNALLALKAIRWGDAPSGFKLLSVPSNTPSAMRAFVYVNSTYIDTDYSTYKAMLISDFAEGLNNTLANIGMSRVWDRAIYNSTFVQIDTGESTSPHVEMNSETQPWGLEAWLQYDLFWQNTMPNSNFPLFITFANQQDTLQTFSYGAPSGNKSSTTTLVVNGTGLDSFEVYTAGSIPSSVTMNGSPVSFAYTVSSSELTWSSQLHSPDTFVISYSSSGGGNKGTKACVASASPTIASPTIRAQIGTTSATILSVSNSGNNVSETIQGITYDPPSGIQIFTTSGIPLSMQPFQGVGTFEIQLTLNNQTKSGTFNVTAVAPFVDSCNNSGQIAFRITILAQSGPVTNSSFSWVAWLDQWWAVILLLISIAFSASVIIWRRRRDD